jgi:hypothetical protein
MATPAGGCSPSELALVVILINEVGSAHCGL